MSRVVLGVTIDEFVANSLVILLPVIVLGVFLRRVAEVALSKWNDLRQALRPDRANESLGVRVQIFGVSYSNRALPSAPRYLIASLKTSERKSFRSRRSISVPTNRQRKHALSDSW